MKTLTEIYRPIQSQLQAAESLFTQEVASRGKFRNGLMRELTRHVAQMPGKRIRPALALLGAGVIRADRKLRSNHAANGRFPRCRLPTGQAGASSISSSTPDRSTTIFGGRISGGTRTRSRSSRGPLSRAVQLATAVEMIHTATLLHDDVIDGATLRRGLSTLNAKWGDTLSVLSGDYLYSKAFCLLSGLNHPRVLNLMSDTARTVCEGEVAQVQHQYDLTLKRSEYLEFIQWKTASLMGGSAQAGALLAGASPALAKRLGVFGTSFGLAFQILDDTQDLVGDQEVLGKSLGTDLALGQLTLPLLYLRDIAGSDLKARLKQWFTGNGSRSTGEALEQLRLLKEEAIQHKVPAYCRRVAQRYLTRARSALSRFSDSPCKTSLLSLTEYLLH